MPSANAKAKELKGLILGADPRIVDKPFIVRGQNFLLDLFGARGYFNSRILSYDKLVDSNLVKAFNVDGKCIIAGNGAIFLYDPVSQRFLTKYTFTDDGSIFPWTMAKVGNFFFFCRKGIGGIIKYDPVAETWKFFTLNLPAGVCAVARSVGRLIALGSNFVAWSSQDDGEDFAPSTVTGAGFQGLSIVNGEGIAVKEVTDGFITFTSAGTLKSEFTTGPNIFRHYPFDRRIVPINPFCVVDTQDYTHIVMDRKGLFQSSGQPYQPFEGLMSEYFSHILAEQLDLSLNTAFRLSYIDCKKFFFVSIGSTNLPDRCERAFCFYIPRGEWSYFVSDHFQILDMDALKGFDNSCQFGYVSPDGYLRHFVNDTFHEQAPELLDRSLVTFDVYEELPLGTLDGIVVARSDITIASENQNLLMVSGTGLYHKFLDQTTASKYVPANSLLVSFIEVGLFRFEQAQYDDEIGLVTNVVLNVDQQTGEQVIEDWNSDPTNTVIDYNSSTLPDEDYGANPLVVSDYQVSIYGTLDGINIFAENQEILTLQDDTAANRYYTCYANGIYHIVRIEMVAPGQSYYLKGLELSGMMVGRL